MDINYLFTYKELDEFSDCMYKDRKKNIKRILECQDSNTEFYLDKKSFAIFSKEVNHFNSRKITKYTKNTEKFTFTAEEVEARLDKIMSKEFITDYLDKNPYLSSVDDLPFLPCYKVTLTTNLNKFCLTSDTKILGVIDHLNDVVFSIEKEHEKELEKYRFNNNCDSCHKDIKRNKTIIVQQTDKDGNTKIMQVGGNCINHIYDCDIDKLASILSYSHKDSVSRNRTVTDINRVYKKNEYHYPISTVASVAIAVIKHFGFHPAKSTVSTKNTVISILCKHEDNDITIKPRDREIANICIQKFKEHMSSICKYNNYDENAKQFFERGTVPLSFFALFIGKIWRLYCETDFQSDFYMSCGTTIPHLIATITRSSYIKKLGTNVYNLKNDDGYQFSLFTDDDFDTGIKLDINNAYITSQKTIYDNSKATVIGGKFISYQPC